MELLKRRGIEEMELSINSKLCSNYYISRTFEKGDRRNETLHPVFTKNNCKKMAKNLQVSLICRKKANTLHCRFLDLNKKWPFFCKPQTRKNWVSDSCQQINIADGGFLPLVGSFTFKAIVDCALVLITLQPKNIHKSL